MTAPRYDIVLDPQRRGMEFRYSSTLGNAWTAAMLTGGLVFTIRKRLPASTILDDTDANVVAQVSVAGGGIVFSTTTAFEVLIPGADTFEWPTGRLFWDLQAKVTSGSRVLDVAAGTVFITADVTRTQ